MERKGGRGIESPNGGLNRLERGRIIVMIKAVSKR